MTRRRYGMSTGASPEAVYMRLARVVYEKGIRDLRSMLPWGSGKFEDRLDQLKRDTEEIRDEILAKGLSDVFKEREFLEYGAKIIGLEVNREMNDLIIARISRPRERVGSN